MDIVNTTSFVVDANQTTDKHGGIYLLALVKATYSFPEKNDEALAVADAQQPIFDADVFEGEPGISTTYFESDWAFRKRRCDVVIKATAFAPEKEAVKQLGVAFQFGNCKKKLKVIGPRTWEAKSLGGIGLGDPAPFVSMPVTYSRSYGGAWLEEGASPSLFLANPVGCGFGQLRHHSAMVGTPGPSVGPYNEPFETHARSFDPVSFGPVGRHWKGRAQLAGTYDDTWKADTFPLLPPDFDERFYQCVPEDQQTVYPKGGEKLGLWNMHPDRPLIRFALPEKLHMPIVAFKEGGRNEPVESVVDTVIIDADAQTLSLVWRGQLPLKRSLREIKSLAFGELYAELWDRLAYGEDAACADCDV